MKTKLRPEAVILNASIEYVWRGKSFKITVPRDLAKALETSLIVSGAINVKVFNQF